MTVISIPRGSVEYVEAEVSADVDLDMAVELAISRGSEHVWLPATWQGSVGTSRKARTTDPVSFDDDYPYPCYSLYARLTDTPEEPIVRVGTLYVLGRAASAAPAPENVVDGGTF